MGSRKGQKKGKVRALEMEKREKVNGAMKGKKRKK